MKLVFHIMAVYMKKVKKLDGKMVSEPYTASLNMAYSAVVKDISSRNKREKRIINGYETNY